MRQGRQNDHQELGNLGLRTVGVGLLLIQWDVHQHLDPDQMSRILTPAGPQPGSMFSFEADFYDLASGCT